MTKQLKVSLIVGTGLILMAGALLSPLFTPESVSPQATPPESRGIVIPLGAATAVPAYIKADAYSVDPPPLRPASDPLQTDGTARYPWGIAADVNLHQVWTSAPSGCNPDGSGCTSSGFDWSKYLTLINGQRAYNVTYSDGTVAPSPVWVHLPPVFMDKSTSACGDTAANACITILWPSWTGASNLLGKFQNTVGGSNKYYNYVKYDDPKLLNYWKKMFDEAAVQMDGKIQGVLIGPGFQREGQPVKKDPADSGTETQLLQSFDQNSGVSCQEYRDFLRNLAEYAYDVFSPKGIGVEVEYGPSPCYNYTGAHFRDDLINNPTYGWEKTTPKRLIGFSQNAKAPDMDSAWTRTGWVYSGFEWYRTGVTARSQGRPVSYESAVNPAGVGGTLPNDGDKDNYRYLYWSQLVTTFAGASNLRDNTLWKAYQHKMAWDVVDQKLGLNPKHLAYVFRRAEFPTYEWSTGYGRSGVDDGFGYWLRLPNYNMYEQACAPWLITETSARNAAIVSGSGNSVFFLPCRSLASQGKNATPTTVPLPTPAATVLPTVTPDNMNDLLNRNLQRQALVLAAWGTYSEYNLTLSSNNPYFCQTVSSATITVDYLDIGTDQFTIEVPGQKVTVTKGGSGQWKRSKFNVGPVTLNNTFTGGATGQAAFMLIKNTDGSSEYIHQVALDLNSAVAPTPTAGPSPTPTYTPSPTTPPTATATRVPTNTPVPGATATTGYKATPTKAPTVTPVPTATAVTTNLRINEISPTDAKDWNLSGAVSAADRWFEIYNGNSYTVNLAGYRVGNGTQVYTFPNFGMLIGPYSRRVFLAEKTVPINSSGTLYLYTPNSSPIMNVPYGVQTLGTCYAANTDGSTSYTNNKACTPGSAN